MWISSDRRQDPASSPVVPDEHKMKDLHILLVGHGCFPNMGSEAGVTWNWAWHLAERNRVSVIAHGFARSLVERICKTIPGRTCGLSGWVRWAGGILGRTLHPRRREASAYTTCFGGTRLWQPRGD